MLSYVGIHRFKGLRSLSIHPVAVLNPNRNCQRRAYKDAALCEAIIVPHHIGKAYRFMMPL